MAFSRIKIARVEEVITDGTADKVGTIKYSEISEAKPMNTDHLPIARPLWKNFSQYPTVNEIVFILIGPKNSYNETGALKQYYLPPINIHGSPHHNALPSGLTKEEFERQLETGEYTKTWFREINGIKPLLPYEGDIIIEGRFGNSIRFGSSNVRGKVATNTSIKDSWSDKGEIGRPITIIKNGQDPIAPKNKAYLVENINNDDSSIYLCSMQQISTFNKSGAELPNDLELSYKHMLNNNG